MKNPSTPYSPAHPGTPWHTAIPLAAGGWLSALVLVAALGVYIFTIRSMRSEPEVPLFMGGIAFLVLARLCMGRACMEHGNLFREQFVLALALAGSAAVSCALALFAISGGADRLAPLAAGLAVAAILPLVRNSAFRHISAATGLLLLFWGLDLLIWLDDITLLQRLHARQAMHMALYAALCVVMAHGWLTEDRWRTNARLHGLLPPLLRGIYCLLLAGAALSLSAVPDVFGVIESVRAAAGLGAGAGLLYCAHRMSGAADGASPIRPPLLGFAALAAIGGFFLPGLSVGLIGLTLGRYRDNTVAVGLVVAALIAYFFLYYYSLDTTLLYKALSLMGSGAGLCLAAFLLYRTTLTRQGE